MDTLEISLEEAKQLVIIGEKSSMEAFEAVKAQISNDKQSFEDIVLLAKNTKGLEMAKTIIDYLKKSTFDFYPFQTTLRRQLCNITFARKDAAALYALEAFEDLSKNEYKLEDQNYLRTIIHDTSDSSIAQAAFKLLKAIYTEKKDKFVTLEIFWDIHKRCRFKHTSFLAFKMCVDEKLFDSWTERDYLGAFDGFHDNKKN